MLFLGIDTSTFFGSIALVDSDRVIAEHSLNLRKTHSERLLPGIKNLLRESGLSLDQIEGVAITNGPGSFTGLRIGLSTAKTLALVTEKHIIGISTLDVLAAGIFYYPGLICAVLDARKGELFTALYRSDPPGQIVRESEYLNVPPGKVLDMIHEPVLFVGNGISVYGDLLKGKCSHPTMFAPAEYHYPRATVLCRLAIAQFTKEGATLPRDLQALYIRPSDAEIKNPRLNIKKDL